MKIKYTCKKPIILDLIKNRVFCKIYTEEERSDFIKIANSWGYEVGSTSLKSKLPIALFVGGQGDKKIGYGEINYNYFQQGYNYQLVTIEEFRNAIMKK